MKIKFKIPFITAIIMMLLNIGAYAAAPAVVDEADLLTDSQEKELTELYDSIENKYGLDTAVVTVKTIGNSTAQDFADDYFDYKGYGAGDDDSGILLLITMGEREYHITTHKKGVAVFNDAAIEDLRGIVEEQLRDGNYYEACYEFGNFVDRVAEDYENGNEYSSPLGSEGIIFFVVAGVIIMFIAGGITAFARNRMNTAVTNKTAEAYIAQNGVNITKSSDTFLYTHTTKTKIESSSSGGSTHSSSSGRSHGGGGGHF